MTFMSSSWMLTPSKTRSLASIGNSALLKCCASALQYGEETTVTIVLRARGAVERRARARPAAGDVRR